MAVLRQIAGLPGGLIGSALVALIMLAAIFAGWISPYDPNALHILSRFAPPSAEFWLGTDQLGRDLLSRHLYGAQVAMLVAITTVALALSAGTALGVVSAYGSRSIETVILVAFDAVSSFPSVILALAAVAVLGPSLVIIVLVIAITLTPNFGRVARAQVGSLRHAPHVEAEVILGASAARVLAFHIVPNILAPLIVLASLDIPVVIAIEAGLSFLGLGVRPPLASWGVLLQDGYQNLSQSAVPVLVSSTALALATLGFTLFGEAFRDAVDPRSARRS